VFVGSGASIRGREAVEKMLRDNVIRYEDGTPRTHHVTSNWSAMSAATCAPSP
jgi:hypothetical protein